MMKLSIYHAENGEWGWRAKDGNNQIIAVSGETYTRMEDATRALTNVVMEFQSLVHPMKNVIVERKPT